MRLSEYERKVLLDSPIYQKYATTQYSTLTKASILADLDAIPRTSIENLPLIKFLTMLFRNLTLDDMDIDTGSNKNNTGIIAETIKAQIGDYSDDTVVHDAGAIVEVSITLSSGAATNTEVIPALASNQCFLLWIVLNATAAPASAYTLTFHSTDATNKIITVVPGDLGKKFWVMFDGDTDNTNIQVDSAGGAGAEVLTLAAFGGTFT